MEDDKKMSENHQTGPFVVTKRSTATETPADAKSSQAPPTEPGSKPTPAIRPGSHTMGLREHTKQRTVDSADPSNPKGHLGRGGPSNRRDHDDPFPLVSESQTPLTDISSSSSDPDTPKREKASTGSRDRAKKARKAAHQTHPTVPSLRPAKDILSRIRHDPDLGGESEYVVGYLDRHEKEPLEMDVTEWKGGLGDVTDEDFIPQHRILYFRRTGDGEGRRVWDRAMRLDRVFGSGVVEEGENGDGVGSVAEGDAGRSGGLVEMVGEKLGVEGENNTMEEAAQVDES